MELIDAYDWEFAMVQYNYMDENSQAGHRGVEYAAEKGVPLFVMEPLRGGQLAGQLPKKAKEMIKEHASGRSAAEWALKWLWDQKAITMVLSGMQEPEVLEENLRIVSETPEESLTEDDMAFYERLKGSIYGTMKVGCTGCAYCMPCPFGVNIPSCLQEYNESYSDGRVGAIKEYFMTNALADKPSYASLCTECGKCMKHCPQSIFIPKEMREVKKRLEIPGFGIVRRIAKTVFHKGG
jgi:predicted aldo/keto reductase-like oxidoreductase